MFRIKSSSRQVALASTRSRQVCLRQIVLLRHLRCLGPGQRSFEETSQWLRAVGDTVS